MFANQKNVIENVFTIEKNQKYQSFLKVDLSRIDANEKAFYGLPLIQPQISTLCLNFFYYISSKAVLRVLLLKDERNFKQIWQHSSITQNGQVQIEKNKFISINLLFLFSNTAWIKVAVPFEEKNEFQLLIEAYKSSSLNESILIRNILVTYGKCYEKSQIRFVLKRIKNKNY